MNTFPARRPPLPAGSARAAAYAGGAIACGLFGWLAAGVQDSTELPLTAVAAVTGAVGLVVAGRRTGMLTGPMVILGVPLLMALAAAMLPLTRIYRDWSPDTRTVAVLIGLAPLAGVAAALLATRGRSSRLEPGTDAAPRPARLVAVCVLMCVAGTLVYLSEWAKIGGPPLLSSNIDKARFGISYGLLHVPTQGLPLSLLIATWARVGRAQWFTAPQKRALEAVICFVPIVTTLGGGRTLVLVPVIAAFVVAARYLSARAARRLAILVPVALLALSTAIFLTRERQHTTAVAGAILNNASGTRSSPFQSTFRALNVNLGEPLRVVQELRGADVHTQPFTTSIWFLHNLTPRAVDPHTITGPRAGGWLTSTYAGQVLLDFGLVPALLFGVAFGAAAHFLYRRFARGRSVTVIWVYAYLASPIALSFYINVFLYFAYPLIDLVALAALSRLLIAPSRRVAAGPQQRGEAVASPT